MVAQATLHGLYTLQAPQTLVAIQKDPMGKALSWLWEFKNQAQSIFMGRENRKVIGNLSQGPRGGRARGWYECQS